jgi:pyridoxamine 5'-phosphate oxidase
VKRANLSPDPLEQFALWYEAAQSHNLPQPNAMSLSTVSVDGVVSSRMMILRSFDRRGFAFYTGLKTQKVADLAAHPQAALLFPWLALLRQVRIEGTAVPLSIAETIAYFVTRPRGSQIGAWLTQSGGPISSRSLLKAKLAEIEAKFRAGQIPLPDAWGGFRLVPSRYEFWQGQPDGLHDRFVYTPHGEDDWRIERRLP